MPEMTTTCISVRRDVLAGLRRLALLKAEQAGGRVSVSGIIEDLARAELARVEAQAKRKTGRADA